MPNKLPKASPKNKKAAAVSQQKPNLALSIIGCIVVVAIVGFISYSFINQPKNPNAGIQVVCRTQGVHHEVVIENGVVNPTHTEAKLCDTLTITNNDTAGRLMAFGVHEDHVQYDGVTEQMLHQGDSFTVTLNRSGTYIFHDHIHDEVTGDFTVVK